MKKNRTLICFAMLFILLFVTGWSESSGRSDKFRAEHKTCYIPLDFGPGFGSTWFSSRSLNTSLSVLENPASGSSEALRISVLKEENQQQIDHIPIYLERGNYVVTFHSSCDRPAQKMSIQLIEMKCDSHGKFSSRISRRLKYDGHPKKQHVANFTNIPKGVYILRLSLASFPVNSKLDLYDFSMYLLGSEPKEYLAQVAPDIEEVLYKQGDKIKIGAKRLFKTCWKFQFKI